MFEWKVFSVTPYYWAETTNRVLFLEDGMIVKFVQIFLSKAMHSLFNNCFPNVLLVAAQIDFNCLLDTTKNYQGLEFQLRNPVDQVGPRALSQLLIEV